MKNSCFFFLLCSLTLNIFLSLKVYCIANLHIVHYITLLTMLLIVYDVQSLSRIFMAFQNQKCIEKKLKNSRFWRKKYKVTFIYSYYL